MFGRLTVASALATIISLGGAAGIANADEELSDKEEIQASLDAKVSLAQAIAAAERETGGKAFGAALEKQDGAVGYSVDVVKGGAAQEVFVDTQSGRVLKVSADQDDGEDEEGGEDDANGE